MRALLAIGASVTTGEFAAGVSLVIAIVSTAVAVGISWGRSSQAITGVTEMKTELARDMKALSEKVTESTTKLKVAIARVEGRVENVENAISPRPFPRRPTPPPPDDSDF